MVLRASSAREGWIFSGERTRVVALAGGTGSAKLLRGLQAHVRFSVVSNVGDNVWMHGLYVCPDIDTAVYAMSGLIDRERGWGIAEDSFHGLAQLERLGAETWFKLGDRDLAMHVLRTHLLQGGRTLTEVTRVVCKRLGVKDPVLPCTDADAETRLVTDRGEMHFQEFWVKRRGRPRVVSIDYRPFSRARITEAVVKALASADRIVICPANPATSILPILSVGGMRRALRSSKARKVAISPMIGSGPVSGPAGKLMAATGHEPTSLGVAKLYRGLIDVMVIDEHDAKQEKAIEKTGATCVTAPTLMKSGEDEARLAGLALEA